MEIKVKEKSSKCWRDAIEAMDVGDYIYGYGYSQLKSCRHLQTKLRDKITISVKKDGNSWNTSEKRFKIERK